MTKTIDQSDDFMNLYTLIWESDLTFEDKAALEQTALGMIFKEYEPA